MSNLMSLINSLCAELRSDKITTRNKAAEQLEDHLSSSKNELFAQLKKRSDDDVSWTTIFNSAIDATIKHAIKVDEAKDSKNYQTMRNKNYIFAAIVNKLMNYNLEDPDHLFSKSTLFNAFQDGFKSRVAVQHFSELFLSILNQGLFKSAVYIRDLKLNEFSIILSYLFETYKGHDDRFSFASLKSINKIIELSHEYVQMSADIIDYFPEVNNFARKATNDSQKGDIIKLYYLMVSQHSVDYHNIVCNGLQELMPIISGFYQNNMKTETKELLFKSVLISLHTIYPYIQQGNINTINVQLCETWPKSLKKVKTMVEVEVKERRTSCTQLSRTQQNDKSLEPFVKMSALVIYLIYWHIENNNNNVEEDDVQESRPKISKPPDKMEVLIDFVQPQKGKFNEIWLSILSELVNEIDTIINITNFQQLLSLNLNILQDYTNAKNLKSIRLCLIKLLCKEKQFISSKSIPTNYCQDEWLKIVKCLITDTSSSSEIIGEKQLLLQELLLHQKLNAENCTSLLNAYMTNAALRRTECILTIQHILKNADLMGLDKTSPLIGQIITWLYGDRDKNEAKTILLHIESVEPQLIAETCAIAVINFLDETVLKLPFQNNDQNHILQLLQFKYNRKFLCLEKHGRELKNMQQKQLITKTCEQKNCLFQCNYELLMRTLNCETSKGITCKDILLDLKSLLKMSLLMKSLLEFEAFDEMSFMQCPLIKRIGFFLSHLELQFKNNLPNTMERCTLDEILNRLYSIIVCFSSNTILLHYLEKQPIEEMVQFLGVALKFCGAKNQTQQSEFDDWSKLTDKCLYLLSTLCASTTHWNEAFEHISKYNFNTKTQTVIILRLTKIFCLQKSNYEDVGKWFVNKLKVIFKFYYTNLEIMTEVVEMLPAIFVYIQQYEYCLDDMLLAMFSLFKISFRKSYSSKLTTKIINSVCYIVRDCRDIYIQDSFRNICLSVVKFLPFTSLEVQYAAINTLTAIMDINWLKNTKCDIEIYYDFCDNIYKSIEWKKLQVPVSQAESPDQLQNSIALNVQLLVALLGFSCYHRENALQELSFVCGFFKLTEADLNEFYRIALFYKSSLTDLVKPCISNAIHTWIAKSYPILKFPFFLCYKTKHDFLLNNIEEIIICLLLYGKSADLRKLEKYGSPEELLKISISVIRAFVLTSQCPANQNNEFKNYVNNISSLDIDLFQIKNENTTWKIMFTIIDNLRDDKHSCSIAGFPIFFQSTKWYNIDYQCLQSVLNYYINNNKNEAKSDVLLNFVSKFPLRLVKTMGALKKSCSECIFPIDSLKQFYKFYTLSDMVVDALQHPSIAQALRDYFIRDIIYYCLHCIESASLNDLKKLALIALDKFLKKIKDFQDIDQFMEHHLNFICKSLVQLYKSPSCYDIQKKVIEICERLLENFKHTVKDKQYLEHEFANNEQFKNIRRILKTMTQGENEADNNWQKSFDIFIENKNFTTDTFELLQKNISSHKRHLQFESNLLYRLIRHLLLIVRQTSNDAISLEALKCLGEIGPLTLTQMSYYFEADSDIEENNDDEIQIQDFYKSLYKTLEKLLGTFEASTHFYIIEVAQYVVNSKYGHDLIENFPYFSVFRTNLPTNYLDNYESIPILDWVTTLKICESYDYDEWICQFVSQIFQQSNWLQFQDLAASSTYFAEYSLIPFIRLLMQCSQQSHMESIIQMLEYFFEEFLQHHSATTDCEEKKMYKEKRVINMILNICECIRINNSWHLPLKLLNVAQACNYCQAYFLSIIYLEMWALEEKHSSIGKTNVEIISNEQFQEIARKAYDSIGCNDAISGFINPLNSRMDYLNLTNNWSDILIESNDVSSSDNTNSNYLCNSILKRNGMLNLASSNANKSTIDYEVCWRLCRWDTVVEGHSKVDTLNDMENEFEKHHFNALKCLYNKEENNALAAINKSRLCVLNILKEISVECLQSVYKYMTWLQLLQQCEDFCVIQFSKSSTIDHIFEKWQMESDDLQYGHFCSKEMILSHHISLFQTAGIRANRKINEFYKDDPIAKSLLKCIHDCKAAGEINLAKRYIAILKNIPVKSVQLKISALLEDVDICMKTGKPEITKAILHHIFKNKDFHCCLQRVTAMQVNGEYLMETNTETFETVLSKFFLGSLELLKRYDNTKEGILQKHPNIFSLKEFKEFDEKSKKSAYEIIAKYADREYTQLNTYANSDEFNLKRHIMESNRQTANTVGRQVKDRDKLISANFMKRFSNIDEQEIHLIEQKVTNYLRVAVENYIKFACLDSAISSPVIYRIIGLWFSNKQNETLRRTIEENIKSVPSFKFICALNQMTARLNSKNVEFITILKDIMIRCVQDHPHQTLYQLYPIVYVYMDGTENKMDYRSKIAQDIIAKAKNKMNANAMKQLENVIPALIEFANTEVKADKSNSTSLTDKLKRQKNLDAIHCPTIDLPVRIDKNYSITSIIKWDSHVSLVGGINAPKKLVCYCSDGVTRPQLLKGKDDLRQDAVMQQVFCMINNLLKEEPEAVERKLMIRTYKVIPLSTRSGILEWCQNTVPIGIYLNDAHKKYRPTDYTVNKCRTLAHQHLKSDPEKRYQMHNHICENIKPVFHYFFFEKFSRPGIWFERRLAYINSVATNSMVGYILGIGDRHLQNILVDQKTAEIIHVDFGIAFELGKTINTPETVPFRLTRNLVAPMGISGANGVFRKSSETTMTILRRHQNVINTILEVLLYDPLYMWNVIPQVEDENQNDHKLQNEGKNNIAQRALTVVQNKLEGKQTGIFGRSSVAVQVERLINDAMNNRNLCMLFPGWDPYFVATTSMVGFILGLGDRHLQNILIDQKTAEVIHIDFGIAFEQGKIMPTPETIPFRLTRDIVAPMGISGPNGVFKKSCETTMTILRRHQDVITTILEVLLYDPLYIWKVIPQVDDENQNDNKSNEGKNFIAQRALLVIQNKLEGKQAGIFGTSSVAVQVERLINDAMNNRNLCMLYPGWDPYL